ncbi:MAG: aminoacyl-tRNA hydrolase [Coriobacteriales bacterium]|nr:aminoacyl-tRNA hydrolase [Coriobacteriales bacterium]
MQTTKLIVGLGNPGAEYAQTRHNCGFMAVDALAGKLGVNYWKSDCQAEVGRTQDSTGEVVLAKPQTFMNLSGQAVKGLVKKFALDPARDLLVIQDELDLEPGTVRLKQGGGHAGHNGLRSIIDCLGSKDFARLRVGIGHPQDGMPVDIYVLQRLKGDKLSEQQDHVAEAVRLASQWLA